MKGYRLMWEPKFPKEKKDCLNIPKEGLIKKTVYLIKNFKEFAQENWEVYASQTLTKPKSMKINKYRTSFQKSVFNGLMHV